MSLNFVALDFETASYRRRNSACSIGIVVHSNGSVYEKHSLIRPEPLRFDPFNIELHGITPDMVKDAPTFGELWPEFEIYLKNNIVVAHNAAFDFSVIRYSLAQYKIESPIINYFCTCSLSKRALPGLINYKLPTVAHSLNISCKHHDALEDARTAAGIINSLLHKNKVESIESLAELYKISIGQIHPDGYTPCSMAQAIKRKKKYINYSKLMPHSNEIDEDNFFYNKNVVFTGTLSGYTRKEAAQIIVDIGGTVGNTVTCNTDYLIVGEQDYSRFSDGKMSSKMKKTLELSQNGKDVQIITESDFMENVLA